MDTSQIGPALTPKRFSELLQRWENVAERYDLAIHVTEVLTLLESWGTGSRTQSTSDQAMTWQSISEYLQSSGLDNPYKAAIARAALDSIYPQWDWEVLCTGNSRIKLQARMRLEE